MTDVLVPILPLALAAAVNPAMIVIDVVLLSIDRAKAAAFVAGFALAFVTIGVLGLTVGVVTPPGKGTVSAVIDLVGAVLLLVLGIRALRGGGRQRSFDADHMPGAGELVGFGAVSGVLDFSSLIPYLIALKEINKADVSPAESAVALAVFNLVALLPLYLPVALVYAAPGPAGRLLAPVRSFLERHSSQITAVVCFAFAAYLGLKGMLAL